MRLSITGATAYTGRGLKHEDGIDIVWEDGVIVAVGPSCAEDCAERIPGGDFFVTPGFVNAHFHPTQQLNRALGVGLTHDAQMDLLHATDRIKQPDDKYLLSMVAVLEALKAGTTSFYAVGSEIETQIRVFQELGIRAACTLIPKDIAAEGKTAAKQAAVWQTEERLAAAEETYRRFHSDLVRVHFGVCNVRYCSDALILGMLELAERFDVYFHMHAAESEEYVRAVIERTGHREVEHLHHIGALTRRVSLAHATQLNEDEIRYLADGGSHIVHCPRANSYVAVGSCPVDALLEAGVNVALGSDAAINNNSNEVRGEARAAYDLLSARLGRPDAVDYRTLFSMLTLCGARAMGLEAQIGSIEPGKKADLVMWSKNETPFIPGHNYLADLVFTDSCLAHTVFIEGRKVLEDHRLVLKDQSELLREARRVSERYHAEFRKMGLSFED